MKLDAANAANIHHDQLKREDKMDMLPSYETIINPTLKALRELGGSAKKSDVAKNVAKQLQLTREQLELRYPSGSATLFGHRMNDVRLALINEKLIVHPTRGIWQLTEKGWLAEDIDTSQLQRPARRRKQRQAVLTRESEISHTVEIYSVEDLIESHNNWREQLLNNLRQLPPAKFERFLRLILQESGLAKVEMMRSDENVCEGIAVMGGGLMSQSRMNFRCLRGSRQLTSEFVTDFRREASMSRAVKGLLITLGEFTQQAEREAERAGSPSVELIDGEKLVKILKDLELGVQSEIVRVERVTVAPDFFDSI